MVDACPRFALVDLETGAATDPGPCVELARARRIEQVSYQIVRNHDRSSDACTQPCDTDPREPDKAQNSAAYLELTGQIPVAVIADDRAYLQGLRFDVRPEGPELDGVIGAGALGRVARRDRLHVVAAARGVLVRARRAPRRVLRGRPLPAAARRETPSTSASGCPQPRLAPTCAPSGC